MDSSRCRDVYYIGGEKVNELIFYARVSRDDLFCENQKQVLKQWAETNKIPFEGHYFQEEETTRKTRPVKEAVLNKYRNGLYKGIVVVKIDRWARSTQELIMDIEGVVNQGGRFVAIGNGFDFQKSSYNASQQLILSIFSAFAQFEREMIRERTLEGLKRARALGTKLGRPRKSPPVKLEEKDSQKVLT